MLSCDKARKYSASEMSHTRVKKKKIVFLCPATPVESAAFIPVASTPISNWMKPLAFVLMPRVLRYDSIDTLVPHSSRKSGDDII